MSFTHAHKLNIFNNFPSFCVCPKMRISTSTTAGNLDQYENILFGNGLTHSHTMTPFDAPWKQAF